MKEITLGTLFDGIGGFPYAALFYGIRPVWASEVLPTAISVTKRHIPEMVHVGRYYKTGRTQAATCGHHHFWFTLSGAIHQRTQVRVSR